MRNDKINKNKIVNDPVHGFISINYPLIFDIIEHPYFQRLRGIKQLGLTYLVYPGANHSRLQHALGAMHLLDSAIDTLRSKGFVISDEEAEAACAAILLHDIGHGPFSHTLENTIVPDVSHESISLAFIRSLNEEFNGRLSLALEIFEDRYHRKFLHQLISGQLDMDRMDYLKRDSFFSGVVEGSISTERIIKMLNVVDDNLVVEAKGIYSIENFLIARRLMYWQVYLHKTVVAAEQTLVKLLQRARQLARSNFPMTISEPLRYFFTHDITSVDFLTSHSRALSYFSQLDDSDIIVAAKEWMNSSDPVLAKLSSMIINRRLLSIELTTAPTSNRHLAELKSLFASVFPSFVDFTDYFVFADSVGISAYQPGEESIQILHSNGQLVDIAEASDILKSNALSNETKKYFTCFPKELREILR